MGKPGRFGINLEERTNQLSGYVTQLNNDVTALGRVGASHSSDIESLAKALSNLKKAVSGLDGSTIKKAFPKFDTTFKSDIENVGFANESLQKFINEVGSLGQRSKKGGIERDEKGRFKAISEVKEQLNEKMQGVQDVLNMVKNLGTKLNELAGVGTGIYNIDKARESIQKFINEVGSLGQRSDKKQEEVSDGTKKVKEQLNKRVEGVRAILDVIHILSKDLSDLGGSAVADGLAALELARPALQQFIAGFDIFIDKPQSNPIGFLTPSENTSNIVPIVKNQVEGLKSVVEAMKPLPEIVAGLNINEESRKNIRAVGESIIGFVNDFSFVRETIYKGVNYSGRSYEAWPKQSIQNFENGLNNVQAVAVVFQKLASALQVAASNAVQGSNALKNSRETIQKFIQEFEGWFKKPHNIGSDKTPLFVSAEEGLKHIEAVSNALSKYAGVLKSMSKFGVVDFVKIQTDFTQFITTLNTMISSDAVKDIKPQDAERLNIVGKALKGMSSFINSLIKGGDFSGVNVDASVDTVTKFINSMSKLAGLSTFPDFERVANSVGKFNGKLQDANATIERSSRAMIKLKSILRQIYTAFVGGAVIYSIVRSIKSAIKEMFNLEYAMARVNTIARVNNETLKVMTHQVQEMSASYGVESAKVSKALYDINSATIKGAASMKILEQSMRLAVAGFTDVEKVSDLIAKAVNAYQYNVSEATKISDILFVTVERGINPMEELSEYFGRLFTVSANAGVSLEEIASGLATLTARGYQTNVASTALNSAILKLSTGTKELNKLFQQYGYASSASALRTVGLAGALQVLNKATGGSTEKLHDLGFNYRDIRAATTLASGAINEYNKTLSMMADETYTANKTTEALAKVQNTVKFQFNKLKTTFVVFVQSISEYLNKNELIKESFIALSKILHNLIDSMRGLQLTLKDQLLVSLVTFIPKMLVAYSTIKLFSPLFLKLKTTIVLVTSAIKHQATALETLSTSFKAVSSSAKTFIAVQAALQGFSKTSSWLSTINEQGIDIFNIAKTSSNRFNKDAPANGALSWTTQLQAGFAGALGGFGNAVDWIFGTDLGERIYDALKPDEVSYAEKSFKAGKNDSYFTNQVSKLKNFNIFENGLNEDKITEMYNEISEAMSDYAKEMGTSKDTLSLAQKELDEWRDTLYKQNSDVLKLMPNTQALTDVFSESSKAIADATEKYAGQMEKTITKILGVEESLSILSKKTNLSIEQIKSGVSSEENLKVLQELIEAPMKALAENAEELIVPIIERQEGRESYLKENVSKALERMAKKDVEGFKANISSKVEEYTGKLPETFGDIVEAMAKFPDLASSIKKYAFSIKNFEFGASFGEYSQYSKLEDAEKLVNPVNEMIFAISRSGLIDGEAVKKLDESQKEIAERWSKLPKEFKYNSEAIAKLIIDAVADPEIRKALKYLSDNYIEVVKSTDQFRKSLSKLGDEMRKLDGQKINVSDIIGNVFGIKSVDELKESIASVLYDPAKMGDLSSEIIQAGVTKYATLVGEGIKSKLSLNEILDNFVKATEGDVVFDGMSPEDIKKKGKAIFDRVKAMTEFTSDFAGQLSNTDFRKFMNKLQFGGEMSAFKQYEEIDSARISEIMSRNIKNVGSFREALKKVQEIGVEEAMKIFGEEGWSEFVNAYKDFSDVWSGSSYSLMQSNKNLKKKIHTFLKNFSDAFLTPIQQFDKTEAPLKKQLAKLKGHLDTKGYVNPEVAERALENIEKLQKLNEETMQMKVPSAITASEAVRTGSKEAFDLVATNIFRDMYKVNVQQKNLQKTLVDEAKNLRKYLTDSDNTLRTIVV